MTDIPQKEDTGCKDFQFSFCQLEIQARFRIWQKARELLPMQRWEIEISKFNLELFNFILPRVFICKSRNGFKVYSFRVHPKVKRAMTKSISIYKSQNIVKNLSHLILDILLVGSREA